MRGRGEVPIFAGLTAFFALLQFFGLWSGALGLTFGRTLASAATFLAAALALTFALQFRPAPVSAPALDSAAPDRTRWLVRLVALAAVLWTGFVWARLWILAWRRAPYDWDGLYYHIPAIHEWVVAGRVRWLESPPDNVFVNYPMGVEATTFFLHAVHGSSRLINACNLWYWPLAFWALVVLARRLGARDAWSWLGAALLVGSPVIVSQSVTCYTDVGHAATVLGGLAAAVLLVFPAGGSRLWRSVLWGASLGLLAGAKGSGLPGAVILAGGTVAAIIIWRRHDSRAWWPYLVLGVGVACAVGGYWYLRSIVHTGNPVYPIQVAIGHKVIFPGYDHVIFSEANLPQWLASYPPWLRMPVAWLQPDAPISGSAPVGGLGYLWPVAGLPAALVLGGLLWRKRGRDEAASAWTFLAVLIVLLLATQTSPWWSRFTIWLIGLGLPCLVVLLQRFQLGARPLSLRLLVVGIALAAAGLAAWESGRTLRLEEADGREYDRAGRVVYPTALQRIASQLEEVPNLEPFWAAHKIGRTQWSRWGTLVGGTLCLPLGAREIVVLPPAPTAADLTRLQAAGVSWLIWDAGAVGAPPDGLRGAIAEEIVFRPGPTAWLHFLRLESRSDDDASPAPD
jgi:hypothetical protein